MDSSEDEPAVPATAGRKHRSTSHQGGRKAKEEDEFEKRAS